MIFQQSEGPVHKLGIGSPQNWNLPLGDDLNAVTATADGAVKAEAAQVNVQQDARKITFAGHGQFWTYSSMARDYSGYLGTHAAVAFDIVVDQAPAAPVVVRMECGFPCGASVDVTKAVLALPLHARATLKIPLQCFAEQGMEFASVDSPFSIDTTGAFVATFANIRWQVGADKDPGVLACTPGPKPIPPS